MSMHAWLDTLERAVLVHQWRLLRYALIAGLVPAALLAGLVAAQERVDPVYPLAAALGLWAFIIWFRIGRYEVGVLAILLAAGQFNFFTLPTGTDSRIVLSLLLAMALVGAWMLEMVVRSSTAGLEPSPLNKPVLGFVLISVAAYLWSAFLRDPLVFVPGSFLATQLAALAVNIVLPLLALLVSQKVRDLIWLQRLSWVLIGLGVVYLVSVGLQLPTIRLLFNGSRGLFATWVAAIAYALALFDQRQPLWRRGFLLLLVAALVYRNFFQNSLWLSGWLPLFVACAVVTLLRSNRLFLLGLVVASLYLAMNYETVYQRVVVANVEEGSGERLGLWTMNLSHVGNHPLFGMGPAGYAVYNMTYHPYDARSTHNNYFDVLAQTGVLGLVVFLWLMATFFRLGHRAHVAVRNQRNFEEAFAAGTFGGCAGVLTGMMLGDWVLPFAYNQTISGFDNAAFTWVYLGAMVSLYHMVHAHPLDRGEEARSHA